MSTNTEIEGWRFDQGHDADDIENGHHLGEVWSGDKPSRILITHRDGSEVAIPYLVMVEYLRRHGCRVFVPGEPLPATLPPEVPEGFVRCRAAVCVHGTGSWAVGGWDSCTDKQVLMEMEPNPGERVSWVTFDAPKPAMPAEIVGEVDRG